MPTDRIEEAVDARIVEAAGDGRVDGQLGIGAREVGRMVAPPLLAHIAQRVLGTAPLEFVEDHDLGEVEHVDLLELARRAVLAGHDIDRQVDMIDDLGVALADAGGLDDDQIEPRQLVERDDIVEHRRGGEVAAPGRERTHVDVRRREAVHADAIAEQRPARATAGRVDRHHGDLCIGEVPHEALQQLVVERTLAGAAGAGDPDHRCAPHIGRDRLTDLPPDRRLGVICALEHRDRATDVPVVARFERLVFVARATARPDPLHHIADHADETERAAILRGVDLLDAVALERLDLVRRDRPAPADHHADVLAAALAEHVDHVGEVLVVPALVGADRDAIGVLVDGGPHDVGDRTVVAEVHDLGALGLQEATDEVDGGIVAIEQRGRGDEPQRGTRALGGTGFLGHRQTGGFGGHGVLQGRREDGQRGAIARFDPMVSVFTHE